MRSSTLGYFVLTLFVVASAATDNPKSSKNNDLPSALGGSDGGALWHRFDDRKDRPNAIMYFPTLVEGTSIIYNLPGVKARICLTGDTLAAIYSGQITLWNDARIAATNPSVGLPARKIQVINRLDENGMSWLLTRYLSQVSDAWAAEKGASAHPDWSTGLPVGNEPDMVAAIQSTPYSLGYAAFYSVRSKRTSTAAIRNRAGRCEPPSLQTLKAAAGASVGQFQSDSEVDAVDSLDPGAYPITGFSGLIVPSYDKPDKHAGEVSGLLRYILTDGQKLASKSGYVALPSQLINLELRVLDVIDQH